MCDFIEATRGNKNKLGPVYQVNNSVTFSVKSIGSEKFFNQMVEALGITMNSRPKGRLRKKEN